MPITIKHPDTYKCSICNEEYININDAIECENNIPIPKYGKNDRINIYDYSEGGLIKKDVTVKKTIIDKHNIRYMLNEEYIYYEYDESFLTNIIDECDIIQ